MEPPPQREGSRRDRPIDAFCNTLPQRSPLLACLGYAGQWGRTGASRSSSLSLLGPNSAVLVPCLRLLRRLVVAGSYPKRQRLWRAPANSHGCLSRVGHFRLGVCCLYAAVPFRSPCRAGPRTQCPCPHRGVMKPPGELATTCVVILLVLAGAAWAQPPQGNGSRGVLWSEVGGFPTPKPAPLSARELHCSAEVSSSSVYSVLCIRPQAWAGAA